MEPLGAGLKGTGACRSYCPHQSPRVPRHLRWMCPASSEGKSWVRGRVWAEERESEKACRAFVHACGCELDPNPGRLTRRRHAIGRLPEAPQVGAEGPLCLQELVIRKGVHLSESRLCTGEGLKG